MKNLKSMLLLVFIGLTVVACKKDDEVAEITNLDFTIEQGASALEISVTPTANGASSYRIYFDAVGAPSTFETTRAQLYFTPILKRLHLTRLKWLPRTKHQVLLMYN